MNNLEQPWKYRIIDIERVQAFTEGLEAQLNLHPLAEQSLIFCGGVYLDRQVASQYLAFLKRAVDAKVSLGYTFQVLDDTSHNPFQRVYLIRKQCPHSFPITPTLNGSYYIATHLHTALEGFNTYRQDMQQCSRDGLITPSMYLHTQRIKSKFDTAILDGLKLKLERYEHLKEALERCARVGEWSQVRDMVGDPFLWWVNEDESDFISTGELIRRLGRQLCHSTLQAAQAAQAYYL